MIERGSHASTDSNSLRSEHQTPVPGNAAPSPPEGGASHGLLLTRLREAIGADRVSTDTDDLMALSRDFLRGSRAVRPDTPAPVTPLAVVRPASTHDVAACVRFAAGAGVPIVECGGGTGLMGGARTTAHAIVLDLRSMNRVLAISAPDRTAHVEAGIVLADLGEALAPHGLVVGHDPWTYPIATVGGTISTNGLGYLGARYGSMGDQVLGLTAVLASGDVIRTRPVPRSSTGPWLKSLFIGAEGTLGIITEAVLRVFPRPEAERLAGYEFADFESGYRAIQALFAAGITPAMVDFGQTSPRSRDLPSSPTPAGQPALLRLGFMGLREEVAAQSLRTQRLLLSHGAQLLPARQTRAFWDQRHVIAEEIRVRQRAAPTDQAAWPAPGEGFDFIHVSLPPSLVLEFKQLSEPLLLAHGVSIGEWGLWNQPELFSMTLQHALATEADAREFAAGVDAALELVQDLGGSMEYCHGAGVRLAHLMEREHGEGMRMLRALKRALDPDGLLNPGKLAL